MSRSAAAPDLPTLPDVVDLTPAGEDAVSVRWRGRRPSLGDLPVELVVLRRQGPARAVRTRLREQADRLLQVRVTQIAPLLDLSADEPGWVLAGQPTGMPLAQRWTMGSIPLATTLAWGIDWCRALECLEEAGVPHLGLRASTVRVTDTQAIVTDLGLAPTTLPENPEEDHACLAPEQVLGLPADHRADVHAVGVLLFRCLTGTWPATIAGRSDLDHWARGDLPEDRLTGLAPGPSAVLRRALARRVADRYGQASHLREDLERLSHGFSPLHARPTATRSLRAPGTATVDHLRRPPVSRSLPTVAGTTTARAPRRWPWLVGGVVGAGIVALGAVVGTMGPAPATTTPPPASPTPSNPEWVAAAGQDQHGPWRDLAIASQRLRLRRVGPATAWIGSPADEAGRQANEDRFLATQTQAVWMLDREVPQNIYQVVMGTNPSHFRGQNLPVENLTWEDAQHFCRRLGEIFPGLQARLPTEVEWELAARAGQSGPFGTVERWDTDRSGRVTNPVAMLPPNAWGLYDLHGNVMEWTNDALASYPSGEAQDRMVATGAQRVARGGGWCSQAADCRSAARAGFMAKAHLPYVGFRFVVLDRP